MFRLSSAPVTSLLRNVCRSALPRGRYCQKANDLQPRAASDESSQHIFRSKLKPSDFDKKVFLWTGRYKKIEDIPEYVSPETISASRSNFRVKVSMAMVFATILGCVAMIISGKRAVKEEKTIFQMNMEKKAKLREEAEKEKNVALKNQ